MRRVVDNSSTSNANQTTDTSTGTSAVKEEPLVSASVERKTLTIKYNGIIKNQEKIKFAVWSDENGQDDIKWYNADKTGKAVASYENHKGFGKYNIHTYSFETGKAVGLNGRTITIAKPKVSTKIDQKDENTYTVQVVIYSLINFGHVIRCRFNMVL